MDNHQGTTGKYEFLKEQLAKSPDDSKKAKMARVGLWGIAAFFLTGLICMFIKPDTAAHVVLLVQIAIGSWTGIVMLYLGAQGSVDYKTTQVLGNTVEKREEHIVEEITITQEELDADSDLPPEETEHESRS